MTALKKFHPRSSPLSIRHTGFGDHPLPVGCFCLRPGYNSIQRGSPSLAGWRGCLVSKPEVCSLLPGLMHFSARKRPVSFSVSTTDGSMTKTITPSSDPEISTVDITYSFDYEYDGVPTGIDDLFHIAY